MQYSEQSIKLVFHWEELVFRKWYLAGSLGQPIEVLVQEIIVKTTKVVYWTNANTTTSSAAVYFHQPYSYMSPRVVRNAHGWKISSEFMYTEKSAYTLVTNEE